MNSYSKPEVTVLGEANGLIQGSKSSPPETSSSTNQGALDCELLD